MSDLAGIHILIVPAWWPSPEQPISGVFCKDYARAFAAAGAKVGVVFPDLVSVRYLGKGTRIPWRPRLTVEDLSGVPVIRIRSLHTAFGRPTLQMRRFRRWLRWGLREYRVRYGEPDVLHAMCAIPAGWACTHLDDPLAARTVVTEHTGPFSLVLTPRAGEAYVRVALAKAAAVVAVGEPLRQEMMAAGVRREIAVCGNPVAGSFTAQPVPCASRDDSSVRAIFVGRLVAEKGLRELVQAAAAVSSDGSRKVHWHFVGDGPLESLLRESFAHRGQADRLHLHGNQSRARVASLMAESDFLVLPSHGETFGMAAAEALCLGLPVLTTRGTACAEFVGEDDGVLVEIGNPESLTTGLRRMLERLPRFDRQAIAGRARQRFSGDAVACWYGRLFREILGVVP